MAELNTTAIDMVAANTSASSTPVVASPPASKLVVATPPASRPVVASPLASTPVLASSPASTPVVASPPASRMDASDIAVYHYVAVQDAMQIIEECFVGIKAEMPLAISDTEHSGFKVGLHVV